MGPGASARADWDILNGRDLPPRRFDTAEARVPGPIGRIFLKKLPRMTAYQFCDYPQSRAEKRFMDKLLGHFFCLVGLRVDDILNSLMPLSAAILLRS